MLPQVLHHGLARLVAIESLVGLPGVGGHARVLINHHHARQVVPLRNGVVIGIMGGRHLHRARAELGVHKVIGDDGNDSPQQWQNDFAAQRGLVTLVGGIDGHRRISQHRFRPGSGHRQVALAILKRIADVPQVAGTVFVDDLQDRKPPCRSAGTS